MSAGRIDSAAAPPRAFRHGVALGGFGGGTVAELPARLSILVQFSGERYKDMASGATMARTSGQPADIQARREVRDQEFLEKFGHKFDSGRQLISSCPRAMMERKNWPSRFPIDPRG